MDPEWVIAPDERAYLCDLAARQAEYAALPVMAERRRQWQDLNDGKPNVRPPFILEATNFMFELLPGRRYRCESKAGRAIEKELIRNVRPHEVYQDDRVIPATFDIAWCMDIDEFGPDVKIEVDHVVDSEGMEVGYGFNLPIKDLPQDLRRLRPASVTVDKERTFAWQAFVGDLLGDLLPVVIRVGNHPSMTLTQRVVHLMGMEAFFLAIYDEPDAVHALMAYLRDNALGIMRQMEELDLLSLNNDHQEAWESSYNFTSLLPATDYEGGRVRQKDRWNATNLQEATGLNPAMAAEFLFPYVREIAGPVGLLYYGCCEAVNDSWDNVRTLPHLRKVSISKWTDEAFMGDALRGTPIVYSRKPDPNFLSVDERLDEDGWAAHIRTTLEAARGCSAEILVRDVYTLHHDLDNARRGAAIALEQIDRHWRPS